jgi:hypothetical protein
MENLSKDAIEIFQYLLPGFVSAWIFYGFTSYTKPSQFERIVQALIFTLLVQGMLAIGKMTVVWVCGFFTAGCSEPEAGFPWSIFCSVILGFAFSYFANNDKFHKLVRAVGWSKETSYPSEWFGAFHQPTTYVVLHLKDERRLYSGVSASVMRNG